MNDTRNEESRSQLPAGASGRLDSWKKIAAHFKRDVTTVQRWERREGMPVHRHIHDKQGSVYAFRSELDAWWEGRRGKLPDSFDGAQGSASIVEPLPSPNESWLQATAAAQSAASLSRQPTPARGSIKRSVGVAALIGASLLILFAVKVDRPAAQPWLNPLANATFTRLTDWSGIEQAAEISPDGRWISFLADHDGRMDAWLTQTGSGSYRNLTQGRWSELVNPSIRSMSFSADGSLITVWTRNSDASRPENISLMAAPVAGGELQEFLPGVAEVAWSHDGRQIVYHTTAAGDPLFIRDAHGAVRGIYTAPAGVHCHFPVWSADDAYIYFARGTPPNDWDIWRIRASGAGLERITYHNSRVSHPVLLDAYTLIYLATDSQGSGPWLYGLNLNGERPAPHRISFGLEHYSSVAASADGARLVATVNESSSGIWSAPLAIGLGESRAWSAAAPLSAVEAGGFSPRTGPNFLLYLTARAGRQSIWKAAGGESRELWSDARSIIVGAPAVSADGAQIAFTVAHDDHTILYAMESDGTRLRAVTRSLALRGDPAWAPDGHSIVSAALHDGEPRLTKIFLDGSDPVPLVSEYSMDPVWAPDGRFLIYSGADVGTTFRLRAIGADGKPYPLPALTLTRGARRVVLTADARSMLALQGEMGHKDFWLVNLDTGEERQITRFAPDIVIHDFDLSRDGSVIMFDRIQESSRIALIEPRGL